MVTIETIIVLIFTLMAGGAAAGFIFTIIYAGLNYVFEEVKNG